MHDTHKLRSNFPILLRISFVLLMLQHGGAAAFKDSTDVCRDGQVSTGVKGNDRCCGSHSYDPDSRTCCSFDGVEVLHSGRGICCGNQGVYQPALQVCCYSRTENLFKLHPYPIQGQPRCCGSELFNAQYETCCRENVFKGLTHCCGNDVFDESEELCCEGSIYNISQGATSCCRDLPYDPATTTCCSGVLYDIAEGRCCRGQAYDPSTSSCCNYVINDDLPELGDIQSCCGNQSYLSTEHTCCSGLLFPLEERTECCGDATYDSSQQLCCGDWYNPVIMDRRTNDTLCCGHVTYEEGAETCCLHTGQVFPIINGQCCTMENGQEGAFDPNFGKCCRSYFEERFYHGVSTDQYECCGVHLLREDQLCDWMNMIPVKKSSDSDDMVCSGINADDSLTYNSISTSCINGILIHIEHSQSVCGNQIIHVATEICCLDLFVHAKFDVNNNERFCCEGSLLSYQPSEEMCCGGMIYTIPEREGSCCGYQAFYTSTEVCEDDEVVRPLDKPHRCGGQYYNKEEHVCCGGELIDPGYTCCDGLVYFTETTNIHEGRCCGGKGYNPSTHLCCDSKVHIRNTQDVECCGNDTIPASSNVHHVCCDGVLQPSGHGRAFCHDQMAYNPQNETVCSGVRYPVTGGTCCGNQLLNEHAEICCDGNTFISNGSASLSCCGNQVYDVQNQTLLCCNNILHHNVEEMNCCGSQIYHPVTQSCCHSDGKFFTYTAQDNHLCCGTILYNTTKHTCCENRLHKFKAGHHCCGQEIIKDSDSLCCDGHLTEKLFGLTTKCCGKTIYNEESHECEFSNVLLKVKNKVQVETKVCPLHEKNCCGGLVVDNSFEGCCVGTIYDKRVQTCCKGVLYSVTDGACCGIMQSPYQAGIQLCCDGMVRNVTKGTQDCCGRRIYNKDRQICCGGRLYKAGRGSLCCEDKLYQSSGDRVCCQGQLYLATQVPAGCHGVTPELEKNTSDHCIHPTSDLLDDIFNSSSTVGFIKHLFLKKNENKDICKAKISSILKHPSDIKLVGKNQRISFGSRCPCEGLGQALVLFTNQSITGGYFKVNEEDIFVRSNREIRKSLKRISH